ncbi:hypothetical protein M406DRAFT_42192 [Cryphonectria parasitica EP155]|uniref:Amidohydrolase 3 domain-containing protein n=1 Tax=Cryphonectria parasitica (strain ATCC 38755 / EP155) TaxID=660469 RepID=A0A9P4Y070_CRYP1|nr:uncharacterized protein M406DRAFT_42192 [Cryphonectria parasitica EP155]KAF3764114.1 hypothetical protein M406DRAFT_42192 [Cryphonectria parasitica EP155]
MPGAETLLVNGNIFQATGPSGKDQQASFASSLLISADGTIRHINTSSNPEEEDEVIRSARASGATVHDLQGRTVLPGFIDGHLHMLLLGLSLQKLDLGTCKDLEDIRRTIKAYAAAHPHEERIMCKSLMHTQVPKEINHGMLDDLDPRPIFIDTKDLHTTWTNQAGIDELDKGLGIGTMPDPPGGKIYRDAEGKPMGLFEEAVVFTLIWPWISRISTLEERAKAIQHAVETFSAEGYVGMIDMAMNDDSWESLLYLRTKRPDLPMRVAAYWLLRPSLDETDVAEQVDYAIEMARKYNADTSPDLKVVGVKFVSDGIVDSCTAALSEPYTHSGTSSDPVWTKEMLLPAVERASRAGLQVAIHAIGDLAIRNAVDVIEAVVKPEQRPRIEHLELTSAEDAARLGRLGITASVQPVHSDPAILRAWPRLIGPHRCERAFAYRDMADSGATIALGSDAPTAPHSLPANCYVATNRRSAREPELETVVNPHFALGLCESVVAGTQGGAYSCFMEGTTGAIQKGLKADLAVLEMKWDKERLLEARVVETWFGGRKVFG